MSRLEEAMNAVRANPKSSHAWSNLGELLASDGQSEKAAQSFQRALQLDPSNPAAQAGLASALSGSAPAAAPAPTSEPAPSEAPPSGGVRVFESPVEEPPVATVAPVPEIQRETEPQSAFGGARPARAAATTGASTTRRPLPPAPTKPSEARVRMGVFAILLALGLCACIFLVAIISIF